MTTGHSARETGMLCPEPAACDPARERLLHAVRRGDSGIRRRTARARRHPHLVRSVPSRGSARTRRMTTRRGTARRRGSRTSERRRRSDRPGDRRRSRSCIQPTSGRRARGSQNDTNFAEIRRNLSGLSRRTPRPIPSAARSPRSSREPAGRSPRRAAAHRSGWHRRSARPRRRRGRSA